MSFTQFTNLDFNTFRTQIKDYLRANSNFTDFDFEGSNFSILIDTLAYNSYVTAYNTNMAVNESFIDSATLRENVVSLARNIGYVPRSKKSSVATVNFNVDVSSINAQQVKLNAGLVALGAVEAGTYAFSIPEDITVTPTSNGIANFNNIEIYEGNYLTKTFRVDSSQANQRFILPNANIDTSSIRVTVTERNFFKNLNDGTGDFENVDFQYNLYTNIFEVNEKSRLFLVQEIEDERYQIMFGDNVLGRQPQNGSDIRVSYIVTDGAEGNGAANFNFAGRLTYILGGADVDITSGISLITTAQSSENGDSIESIDNIKYLAPRVYASQYRAVTPNDYKSLIPFLYPNIDSVSAYGGEELDPPQFGKVYITVKPKNGEFLSAVAKDSIKNDLKKYTVAGIKQEFLDLMYLYVEFDSTVSYDSGFVSDKLNLQSRILSAIENYAKSADINSFGGRLKYSKLLSQIDKVDTGITSNITTLVIRRNLVPSYNTLATYEVCYGNKFHADLEGFNIRSSAFKIDGVDGDIYLADFPNNDQSTGIVKFFTIVNSVITYVNNNAGTVDYIKGEVILFPVNIVSTTLENRVEIEVTPESNDIVAKENLYIVLDTTGNSKLNLLEDVLVSGSNVSETNYIPPSSFISNKKYTR
jgi:hypothetical protein